MQALLSFEQAPPIAAPFRFFLGAPVFGMIAGVLVLWYGPALFESRWSPGMLALTHAVAAGFVLQAMLGALIQILPVVAGANLWRPLLLARIVHTLLVAGIGMLLAAFLGMASFLPAIGLLALSCIIFIAATLQALFGRPPHSPTITGLKLAVSGLAGVAALGIALAAGLAGYWPAPLLELADIHVAWGFAAWGLGLLAAVSYVVVPMFQLTPPYPHWFMRPFGALLLACVVAYSPLRLGNEESLAALAALFVVWLAAGYCGLTLWLQARSRRARFDTTQKLWRTAMCGGLAACLLWGSVHVIPALDTWAAWPMLFGMLVLQVGFVSVIAGMFYKIIPFLVWLHLQNRGRGRVMAPNMNAVLAERRMIRHFRVHLAACLLLPAAVICPTWLAYPAGIAVLAANALLGANLLEAVGVYRRQARAIDAALAAQA